MGLKVGDRIREAVGLSGSGYCCRDLVDYWCTCYDSLPSYVPK